MLTETMATLGECCLRATVVLCAAWALTSAMRRASASTRHFVWMCAIAGSMVASAMSFTGPRWTVVVPSSVLSTPATVQPDAAASVAPSTDSARSTAPEPPTAIPSETPRSTASPTGSSSMDLTLVAVSFWAAGALAVLAFVIVGVAGAWWIRRSSIPVQAAWVDEAHVLAEAFEISGPIAFVESGAVTMPMVCGLWRPHIVMPQGASQWTDERRRVVVLHELAHIKRRDCLTQGLAHVVCAAYWFNPIVWLAARRLRAERERACDDFVLAAGEKGPDYAAHLLEIARAMRNRRMTALAGLAMARPSQIEGRLLAILDPAIRRSSTLHTRLALLALVFLIALPVGGVRLQGSTPPEEALAAAATAHPVEPVSPVPSRAALPTSKPGSTPVSKIERPARASRQSTSDVEADRFEITVGETLGAEIGQQIAAALSAQGATSLAQGSTAPDPKTIEALIGALGDSDPDVREMVVITLGRMRDPRVVTALLPLLKDPNADVREKVVFALARTGDARATAAVSAMIDDASPDVREQAVHLLGQSRNRDAVPVLVKALKDSSADVREQAAFGLGQLRDPSAVDPLLEMFKDSSPDVREQTAFALGQIRNGKAVDGLMGALRDSNPDVREQAAFALGQIRDTRALPALTAALRDSVADVREQAAFAIGQISGHE
jgi:beta-lactamase regulating signal transducer with metallopeptidase domain